MPVARVYRWLGCLALPVGCGCGSEDLGDSAGEEAAIGPMPTAFEAGTVLRLDSRLASLVSPGALIARSAEGIRFTEGPVWIREDSRLVFSD